MAGLTDTRQEHLREQLPYVMAPAQRPVGLDLEEVSFCDSAGLNVLLDARCEVERAAVAMVLACVPATRQRVLQMTGADQILKVFATVTDAEAALASRLTGPGQSTTRCSPTATAGGFGGDSFMLVPCRICKCWARASWALMRRQWCVTSTSSSPVAPLACLTRRAAVARHPDGPYRLAA
ncbi:MULTISPECIES: STAS domain-containing protein [unclassified Streptomyces]|uniref:STAS domain-containing protein n=1 Tax=unclassified Streptomyces TaxID=2593676 RepID=UPI0040439237